MRVEIPVSVDGPLGGRVVRLMPVDKSDNPRETNERALQLAAKYGYTNARLFLEEVWDEPAKR